MKNKHSELIDIFYDLHDVLGEVETVACAIKELAKSKDSMSMIIQNLDFLRTWHYEEELNFLYDMKMDDLRAYRVNKMKRGTQTTLEDFI